ncbi:KDO2-lipid IV(A) lauroyltransferase [Flavobacterium succinicans]|uniref:KDO2-lipid IV(A) lauroyltransferase n=1 Tax=Flavobacterium succinicans TaxID=29536 RepID=A0A1I4WQ03_9FLAO|nr:lysophospholipid acyltransferase family protein [Flavobacterium succinicans]SFN15263.1 KDO2-lipid IV(A) lauroyltransferase [Flavobacterium succinicans]
MQLLVYILVFPFLWMISILPFRVFYWFSDLIYLIVYRVVGYRKQTVRDNIALALPHLTTTERLAIEKKFFRHMCDMFLEMIKTLSISHKEMDKRFKITNIELVKKFENKGKSTILMTSHYASWEWLMTLNNQTKFYGVGVYKKIANKYFDQLVRDIRSRFNAELVETTKAIPLMRDNEKTGKLFMYGLVSDQSPKLDRAFHWHKFMGIEVPVHTGAEMLAKRYDFNVLFVDVKKVKRGYYEATFVNISEDPTSIPNFEMTERYLKLVEKQILDTPEYYLWTHKRWKHKR